MTSAIVGMVAFAACLPLLATSPLNGDGQELVRVVNSGGALHPPGFPLQALLDSVCAWLPWSTVAWRLSLLSALAHGVAVACIAEAAGRAASKAAARPVARVVAGAAFAVAPTPWQLAVQPEVFAVAHALFAALVLFAVVVEDGQAAPMDRRSSWTARAVALGALVGAAAGSHPITVLAAPFFLLALARLLRLRATRLGVFAVAAGSFVVVVVALYGTLLSPPRAPWPAWGAPQTVADVVHHALRADYGGALAMSSAVGVDATSALDVLAHATRAQPVVAAVVVLLAALGLRSMPRVLAVAWSAAAALAFVVASLAAVPAPFDDAVAVVERMLGPVWIVLAFSIGVGAGHVAHVLPRRGALVIAVGGLITLTSVAVIEVAVVDASADHTLYVVARAEGAALPRDAVFVVAEDTECMGGAVLDDGTRRDAVCSGLLGRPWYDATLRTIEPRVPVEAAAGGVRAVIDWARGAGLVVATPHDELVDGAGPLAARGPLVLAGVDGAADGFAAVRVAAQVCPLLRVLEPLPRGRHAFTEGAWLNLARGFDAAAHALGPGAAGREAQEIADGLRAGVDPATWREGCVRFARAVASEPTR